jgi:uncharacterized SAM-binding protein YcdF (DUF218 family)
MINYLIDIISSTITFYWVLIVFSLLFLLSKRKKIFIVFIITANSYLCIICFSPLPFLMVKNLESKYEPIDLTKVDTSKMYHIFVLGGGHTIASHLPANDQLEKGSLVRLIEGIRIYRLLPHSKIICSGQSTNSAISQAQLVAQTALDLGVNKDDLLLFHTTSNTLDEARKYKDSLYAPNINVILVTDAMHMKRATECFEHFNIQTIADPSNHRVKFYRKNHNQNFTILLDNFEFFNHAIHEYVGSLYMKTLKNE